MTQQTLISPVMMAGIIETDTPKGLEAITTPECAAVIWRRKSDFGFQAWIDTLDPALLPEVRLILRLDDIRSAVTDVCDMYGTPDDPERAYLINDISMLANIFAGAFASSFLRLRLSPINTNACRRFHIDAITARLICTYRGTGTQYGISKDGTPPRGIFTVPTGAPIVLRGTNWPERPASGLLHRSPPIEGTDETRLVLVIDPIFDPEDAV
jgi:hypothetical protein